MRYLSIYFALVSCFLTSCSFERNLFARVFEQKADSAFVAQKQVAPGVKYGDLADARGTVLVLDNIGKLKINGPVTIQAGQGNTAAATGTDNTGRGAESGANGGHSEATTDNRVPLWALALLAVVSAGAGVWVCWRWMVPKPLP